MKQMLEQINTLTQATIKDIHSHLKGLGYSYKRYLESAIETRTYTKANTPTISVCGWHGNGKYGNVQLIMAIFADNTEIATVASALDFHTETCSQDAFDDYKANCQSLVPILTAVK